MVGSDATYVVQEVLKIQATTDLEPRFSLDPSAI